MTPLKPNSMWLCVLAAFCASLSATEAVTVAVSEAPVSAWLGRVANLPCWLTPPRTAEGLEVRWYRPKRFDNPVLLYREKLIQEGSEQAEYVGRTSLGLRDAKSEGLKGGDVTLDLANVTLEDAGEYVCYVSSDQTYDSASVYLNVTVMGTPPLLSAVRTDAGSVNVSCVSSGWQPRPRVQWSDGRQTLSPQTLNYSKGTQGLVSVQSWVTLQLSSPSSSWVSCSLGLPGREEREGRVDLLSLAALPGEPPMNWKAPFIVVLLLLMALIIFIGVQHFRSQKALIRCKSTASESKGLGKPLSLTVIEDMRKHQVCIRLDRDTAHPSLKVSADCKIVRDNLAQNHADEHQFVHPCILGKPGFTAGCAYWEIELGDENVGLKESWWVGVASASSVKHETQLSRSNGFWFLSSEKGNRLQVNNEISFPVILRPQILGVYLDYDKEQISFYNVKEGQLIVTIHTCFTGEVFPLFNPGKGDKAPMKMLDPSFCVSSSESEPLNNAGAQISNC